MQMKWMVIVVASLAIVSCNNSASIRINTDSLEAKADSLGVRIDSSASRILDSGAAGFGKIRRSIEARIDSTNIDSVAERFWDSTKAKGREFKGKLKKALD